MTEEMRVARPKGTAQTAMPSPAMPEPPAQTTAPAHFEKRGPGRPSIADRFDVLRQVATLLKTTDKNSRREILETLRDLTE